MWLRVTLILAVVLVPGAWLVPLTMCSIKVVRSWFEANTESCG